jgi:hypothetical protein
VPFECLSERGSECQHLADIRIIEPIFTESNKSLHFSSLKKKKLSGPWRLSTFAKSDNPGDYQQAENFQKFFKEKPTRQTYGGGSLFCLLRLRVQAPPLGRGEAILPLVAFAQVLAHLLECGRIQSH